MSGWWDRQGSRAAESRDHSREGFADVTAAGRPVVLRGLVADWPVVRAAATSPQRLGAYLKAHDSGAAVETFASDPGMQGRYFYNEALDGFNFEKGATSLSRTVDALLAAGDGPPQLMIYAGSAPATKAVPGFMAENPMPLLDPAVEPRLWLGNASRIAAHYDNSRNIACCVSGRRRFILFPPDQIGNLYLGPINFTMAGPPASMVDFHAPDLERYPRFADAQAAALVADLEPGDAIYVPSLWWHHVEATGAFNLLVNYWWQSAGAGAAFESILLAMMDVRDQPAPERDAWRAYFEHFVFGEGAQAIGEHLPERWQFLTGKKSRQRDAAITAHVIERLGRRLESG